MLIVLVIVRLQNVHAISVLSFRNVQASIHKYVSITIRLLLHLISTLRSINISSSLSQYMDKTFPWGPDCVYMLTAAELSLSLSERSERKKETASHANPHTESVDIIAPPLPFPKHQSLAMLLKNKKAHLGSSTSRNLQ